MSTWQKAWECFQQALRDEKFPEYCALIPPEKDKRFFGQMATSIRQAGITIQIVNYLDETLDNNGNIVFRTGCVLCEQSQNPKPRDTHIIISPLGKSTVVLSHEFAHAADYLLHGYSGRRQMEIIASAASYLFICKHLGLYFGLYSSRQIIQHAQKWGIKPQDLSRNKKRILKVFCKMNSLYRRSQNKSPHSKFE